MTATCFDDRARDLCARVPLIDGHNDLPWRAWLEADRDLDRFDLAVGRDDTHTDIPRLRSGGLGAQFWAAYVPCDQEGDAAVTCVLEQIDLIHRMIARYPDDLGLALTAGDIERVHGGGRIASLIGVEGGHAIHDSLAVLRMLYALGARYMTLTHSKNCTWADSATDERAHGGLTDFGREVVAEMNRLGMLVDLAHVSDEVMHQVLDVARSPVVFTHSSARALCDHARNVPDDVLARVRVNGGVVMVTFVPGFVNEAVRGHWARQHELRGQLDADAMRAWNAAHPAPAASLDDVVRHIEHVREVAGIDHVGIGGDFDGIESTPVGLEDVSKYHALLIELMQRGWSDDDCTKVAGANLLRAFRAAEAR